MVIDGNLLAHKSIHAFEELRAVNEEGIEICTGMAYGFMRTLLGWHNRFKPKRLRICWDSQHLKRKEIYPKYKDHRGKKTNRFIEELNMTEHMLMLAGIPQYKAEGAEADDLLGCFAKRFKFKRVLIVTSDKDLLQCVKKEVHIFQPKGKYERVVTEEVFHKEFGFWPDDFADYLALIGDKGDNIPGINGIGPVNAKKMIKDFGSMNNMFTNETALREKYPRQAKALFNEKSNAMLYARLTKIDEDVELKPLYLLGVKPNKLKKFFKKYKFNSFTIDTIWERIINLGLDNYGENK